MRKRPERVAAIVSTTLEKPVDVAVLPEAEWPKALADAHFSKAALAGCKLRFFAFLTKSDVFRCLYELNSGEDAEPGAT